MAAQRLAAPGERSEVPAVGGGLLPGDVVVATEVRGPDGVTVCDSEPLVSALHALGIERVHVGPLISADHVVRGAERTALAGTGALAVDMESAWLAPAAAGRPFAVLRVALDTPAREIHRPLSSLCGGIVAWRALRRAAPALAHWAGVERRTRCAVGGPCRGHRGAE